MTNAFTRLDEMFDESLAVISRQDAMALGLSRYFTGKPCRRGHVAEKRVEGGCCVCKNESEKRYRDNKPEERRERQRKYYAANPDKVKYAAKARRKRDPFRTKQDDRRYWLKGKYGITPECYNDMYVKQNGKCAICARECPLTGGKQLRVDHCHVLGHVRGLLCLSCNLNVVGMLENSEGALPRLMEYLRR